MTTHFQISHLIPFITWVKIEVLKFYIPLCVLHVSFRDTPEFLMQCHLLLICNFLLYIYSSLRVLVIVGCDLHFYVICLSLSSEAFSYLNILRCRILWWCLYHRNSSKNNVHPSKRQEILWVFSVILIYWYTKWCLDVYQYIVFFVLELL